jgi:threonine/homoserine/homoserine lactone efflux protein
MRQGAFYTPSCRIRLPVTRPTMLQIAGALFLVWLVIQLVEAVVEALWGHKIR